VNSNKYIAIKLLELAKNNKDPVFILQCLLEAIERTALAISKVKDSEPDYKVNLLEVIRKDEELYISYSYVIDEMFNYILNEEIDEKVIKDVEGIVLKKLNLSEE
jgi:hypothetical protein